VIKNQKSIFKMFRVLLVKLSRDSPTVGLNQALKKSLAINSIVAENGGAAK
jgi:hypothetical protein